MLVDDSPASRSLAPNVVIGSGCSLDYVRAGQNETKQERRVGWDKRNKREDTALQCNSLTALTTNSISLTHLALPRSGELKAAPLLVDRYP